MNKTEAVAMANNLIQKYGLIGWSFEINYRAKNRLGCCKYGPKVIELSAWCLNGGVTEGKAEDTILHEVAHAIAGHTAKHGPVWKAACRRIGADPTRLAAKSTIVNAPKEKYKILCCGCKSTIGKRHRRSNLSRYRSNCCKADLKIVAN